jgi:DNA-directed RNA polymerase sigma subunit (sigma70/sigma32)
MRSLTPAQLATIEPERTREMILERYGLVTGKPRTFEQIGIRWFLSRERVRQIIARGQKILRMEIPEAEALHQEIQTEDDRRWRSRVG